MRRIHILCAMRDARVVENLRRKLDERCTFRVVSSGDAAMKAIQRFVPDILVIDAVLPYLDGIGVIERLRAMPGSRMPLIIGGSVMGFSDSAFEKRGVTHRLCIPWTEETLCPKLEELIAQLDSQIDWVRAETGSTRAAGLLRQMGMRESLRGFEYLSWAAALASENGEHMYAVGKQLYAPIAERFGTTPQNVERLIRHAVERTTDTVGAHGIYNFFGNTIDPMRGKPTNAQIIGMLAQRMRVS